MMVWIKPINRLGTIYKETKDSRGEPLIYVVRHDDNSLYVCREFEIERLPELE